MPRNIVVRFSDGPDMAIAVYRGCADISRLIFWDQKIYLDIYK